MIYWILFTCAALGPLALDLVRGSFDVFNARNGFVAYLYLQIGGSWLATQASPAVGGGLTPLGVTQSHYNRTFLVATIGIVAFHLAYRFSGSRQVRARSQQRALSSRRVARVVNLLFCVGVIAFLQLVSSGGGLASFVENRQSWRAEGVSGQGMLLFPATTLLAIAVLFALVDGLRPGCRSSRMRLVALCVASLIPAAVIGFRALLLLPALQYLLIYSHTTGRVSRKRLIVAALTIAMLFTGYGVYRQWKEVVADSMTLSEGLAAMAGDRPELYLDLLLRSRGADVVSTVIARLDEGGHHVFFLPALLEAATIAVPRSIWPGKPTPLGVEFSYSFFGVEGGVSPTIIGEFYWHMGTAGVILGMVVFGFIVRRLYGFYLTLRPGDFGIVPYAFAFVYVVMSAEAVQGYLNAAVITALALAVVYRAVLGPKLRYSSRLPRRSASPDGAHLSGSDGARSIE